MNKIWTQVCFGDFVQVRMLNVYVLTTVTIIFNSVIDYCAFCVVFFLAFKTRNRNGAVNFAKKIWFMEKLTYFHLEKQQGVSRLA